MATFIIGPHEELPQITVSDTVKVEFLLPDTTGVAGLTGVAFDDGGVTIRVSKPGSDFAAFPTFATENWHEVGNGWYQLIIRGFDATERALLDTEGAIKFYVKFTASNEAHLTRKIVSADVVRTGTGTGQLSVTGGRADSDLQYLFGVTLAEGGAGRLAASFNKLHNVATPLLTTAAAMRGTEGAALAATMEAFFQLALRSDAAIASDRSAQLAVINADEGSGAGDFDNTSEALEALEAVPAAALVAIHLDHLMVAGQVSDVSPSATGFDTNLSISTINEFAGGALMMTSGAAVNAFATLKSTAVSNNTILFMGALNAVPANGDTFVIFKAHRGLGQSTINSTTIAANAIGDSELAADTDVYSAKIVLVDDAATPTDRWLVAWFKNGAPVLSGITNQTIQVIEADDGADLFAAVSLAEIASTGYWQKTQASTVVISGKAYIAVAVATIGGGSRTWPQPVGRDSTS